MGFGLFSNRVPLEEIQQLTKYEWNEEAENLVSRNQSNSVQAFLEQVVCSCGDLGFLGNQFSTFSANVNRLRLGKVCSKFRH